MSVHACTPVKRVRTLAAALLSVRIDATASSTIVGRDAIEFDRRADDTGADRLGEDQCVANLCAGVGEDARRIDGARDRVSKFDLLVLHGMPAEKRDAGFAEFVVPTLEDGGDDVDVESLFGKARNRERRERPPAHRIDIAQRIGRGDLAIDIRVVDDRRKEINRLHKRRATLPRVHTCIVCGPEIDQDSRVVLRR